MYLNSLFKIFEILSEKNASKFHEKIEDKFVFYFVDFD